MAEDSIPDSNYKAALSLSINSTNILRIMTLIRFILYLFGVIFVILRVFALTRQISEQVLNIGFSHNFLYIIVGS